MSDGQAHEDRNLANKLTPAEKREKKIRKLTGAAGEGEARPVALYRVADLSAPQHRFKVRANAEVNTLLPALASFCFARCGRGLCHPVWPSCRSCT